MTHSTKIPGMMRIHSSYSAFEAHLWRDRLRADGIAAQVRNGGLVGAMGELPPMEVMIEVWVPEKEADTAESIIRHGLGIDGTDEQKNVDTGQYSTASKPVLAVPERCPACQSPWEPGFDTCWNCCETLTFD